MAASVGPYGAVLADGSEYSGDYGLSDAALRDFHGPRTEVLATAGADLLAIETIPSEQEATVLLQVLDEMPEGTAGVAVAHLRGRGYDAGAVTTSTGSSGWPAVTTGSSPSASTAPRRSTSRSWCRGAVAASGKPAVAYPEQRRELGRRHPQLGRGRRRRRPGSRRPAGSTAGARYVGGCCRVGATDIARLAATLQVSGPVSGRDPG